MSTINVLGPVGFNPTGPYDATRTYQKLDVVYYQGSSYVAISDSLGQLPTNADYWLCIALGISNDYVIINEDAGLIFPDNFIMKSANKYWKVSIDDTGTISTEEYILQDI